MIRKWILFNVIMCLSTTVFCQKEDEIYGTFKGGGTGDYVFIFSNKGHIDSVQTIDGSFRFDLKMPDTLWDVYFIKYPKLSKTYMFPLFLRKGSNMSFEVDETLTKVKLSGDKISEEQGFFYQKTGLIVEEIKKLKSQIKNLTDSTRIQKLKRELKIEEEKYKTFLQKWVEKRRNSPFSVVVIRFYIDQSQSLKRLDQSAAAKFDLLTESAKEGNYQAVVLQKEFSKYDKKYYLLSVGDKAPDFSLKDTANRDIRLTDFSGQWLLMDFWASWCGPCRRNNPALRIFNDRYKHLGLNILSISLDKDKTKWRKAIIEDSMSWYHGSDFLEFTGVAEKYQIIGVPTYYLVSPDGEIAAKSIGGDISIMEKTISSLIN